MTAAAQPALDNAPQIGEPFNPKTCGFYPADIVEQHGSHELALGLKVLYQHIASMATTAAGKGDICRPSQIFLARKMGMTRRQVQRYTRGLIRLKLIRVKRPNRQRHNVYELLWHQWFSDATSMSPPEATSASSPEATSASPLYKEESLGYSQGYSSGDGAAAAKTSPVVDPSDESSSSSAPPLRKNPKSTPSAAIARPRLTQREYGMFLARSNELQLRPPDREFCNELRDRFQAIAPALTVEEIVKYLPRFPNQRSAAYWLRVTVEQLIAETKRSQPQDSQLMKRAREFDRERAARALR
jgi:hypothetical protein